MSQAIAFASHAIDAALEDGAQVSLTEVAAGCGLKPYALSRLFRKELGLMS